MEPLKVKVVRETKNKVTVKFITVNRSMPMDRALFKERVENGIYKVL